LAQTNQDGRCCLSDAIMPVALSHYTRGGIQTVVTVGETSGNQSGSIKCVQYSQ
jgi:hypothetical protein